jgi:4-amino-4-deoxy-L-arabinose transferase-like glycosyltransferase
MAMSVGSRPPTRPNLAMLANFAVASHARAVALLVVVALLAFLPGFFQIPPVDRDEARFAQATKQMVASGDYVDIRFQNESRYKKPVGIYWLQAAVVQTADAIGVRNATTRIALYRLPSLIGAIGAVLLTYWAALAFVSRRAAVLAGVLMATSILLGIEARLAKTDAMLLAACVAAMGALGRLYLTRPDEERKAETPWLLPGIFWTAVAGGILLKGPLILMFIALTIVTLVIIDRKVDWLWRLKPAYGIAWMLLLVSPWFLAITARTGWSFFSESVGGDLMSKVASGQEAHGMPPGYYALLFWVTFFPGSILAGLAAPAIWRVWREPGAKFLLAWTIPAWIVMEIVATKLPHYVLPLYPSLAILIAGVVDSHMLSQRGWLVHGTLWWLLITGIIAVLVIVTPIAVEHQIAFLAWPLAAVAVIFALRAWWLYDEDGAERALLRAGLAAVLLSMAVFGAMIPRLPALFPANQVARYLRSLDCVPQVAAAGYHEPSLVFLVGTNTHLTDGNGAADFLRAGGCRVAVVESSQERAFALRADAIGLRYGRGRRIEGINISGGRRISLAVFRAERS